MVLQPPSNQPSGIPPASAEPRAGATTTASRPKSPDSRRAKPLCWLAATPSTGHRPPSRPPCRRGIPNRGAEHQQIELLDLDPSAPRRKSGHRQRGGHRLQPGDGRRYLPKHQSHARRQQVIAHSGCCTAINAASRPAKIAGPALRQPGIPSPGTGGLGRSDLAQTGHRGPPTPRSGRAIRDASTADNLRAPARPRGQQLRSHSRRQQHLSSPCQSLRIRERFPERGLHVGWIIFLVCIAFVLSAALPLISNRDAHAPARKRCAMAQQP